MNLWLRIPTWFYLIVFVILALIQVYLVRDIVMGDAFIHFTFARGIAQGQPFFYNGVFSAGSTSPLWSLLLVPLWSMFGDGAIEGVKVLASIFVALSIVLTYFLARRLSGDRGLALVASFLVATSYVLSHWAAKGMETPMFVSLVLGSFLVYYKILGNPPQFSFPKGGDYWQEIFLGVLLGLAILTRPEGWLLAVFLGVPLLIRRGWRVLLTVALPGLLIPLPYYIYLYAQTGQIFPSSVARILHAQQWARQTFGIYWTPEILKILVTKFAMLTPFFLFLIWDFVKGKVEIPDQVRNDRLYIFTPIWLWLTFHLLFFTFVLPMTQGYRYLLAALPFFIILSLLGLWQLKKRGFFTILLLIVLSASVVISTQQLIKQSQKIVGCEVPVIDRTRRETGMWLKKNTAPTDVIALKEVDQSAYYSGRQVLSMDGTLDMKAVPFVRTADQLGFINKYQPDWLVLEEDMYALYPAWQQSNLQPLIDSDLALNSSKILNGTEFTLVHKIPLGTPQQCAYFKGDYSWWFYRVKY